MSKFYLVLAGMKSGLWILVASLIINSAISLYYYLRIIRAMLTPSEANRKPGLSFISVVAMILIASGILFLGVLPSFLMKLISNFTA